MKTEDKQQQQQKQTNKKQEWWRKQQQQKQTNTQKHKTKTKLEWQINFFIIIYTVLQMIYNVYGKGYLRRSRRGNLHHYSVRDYNHSS